jgi:Uma2 family endonuclease
MRFRIDRERGLERRPDVAFVSHERWPLDRRPPRTAAWDVVPDLAVEVISPNNRSNYDRQKLVEYFRAGVPAVWFVYPDLFKVDVCDSPMSVRILALGESLEWGTILPGFTLPLAVLFGQSEAPPPTSAH